MFSLFILVLFIMKYAFHIENNSVKINLVQEGESKQIMLHTVLVYKTCAYTKREHNLTTVCSYISPCL